MMADQIVSRDDVSALTGGRVNPDSPVVEAAIDSALAYIRAFAGWHITPVREEMLTLDGNGATVLQLPSLNVTGVESVSLNGEVLPEDAYSWSAQGMLRRCAGVWPRDFRNVTVTFRHGYESCPVVASVVASVAARAASTPTGLTSLTVGGRSEGYRALGDGAMIAPLASELSALSAYKLPTEA